MNNAYTAMAWIIAILDWFTINFLQIIFSFIIIIIVVAIIYFVRYSK